MPTTPTTALHQQEQALISLGYTNPVAFYTGWVGAAGNAQLTIALHRARPEMTAQQILDDGKSQFGLCTWQGEVSLSLGQRWSLQWGNFKDGLPSLVERAIWPRQGDRSLTDCSEEIVDLVCKSACAAPWINSLQSGPQPLSALWDKIQHHRVRDETSLILKAELGATLASLSR